MNSDAYEERMRQFEIYHGTTVIAEAWPIIRVDGRSFSRLTADHFTKPFDEHFHDLMVFTAKALLGEMGGVYAYTESDEISVVLPRDTTLFSREVEKLVSISAAVAASVFSVEFGVAAQFDSRIWVGVGFQNVIDYLRWRLEDGIRCGINGQTYWTLRNNGMSVEEATEALYKKNSKEKQEIMRKHGQAEYEAMLGWKKNGTALYWGNVPRVGMNPQTNTEVTTTRRQVVMESNLPRGEAYDSYVQKVFLEASAPRPL